MKDTLLFGSHGGHAEFQSPVIHRHMSMVNVARINSLGSGRQRILVFPGGWEVKKAGKHIRYFGLDQLSQPLSIFVLSWRVLGKPTDNDERPTGNDSQQGVNGKDVGGSPTKGTALTHLDRRATAIAKDTTGEF